MIGDVQSILGNSTSDESREKEVLRIGSLTTLANKKALAPARKTDTMKKPEGMARELYNLMGSGDDLQSVMPAETKKYRNPKVQMGFRAVRKYKWAPFTNEARSDGLQLHHWQRVDRLENSEPYAFSRFNKVIQVPQFTDEEYENYLKSSKWSKEETEYLFEVCRQFDIRWPIVVDRYDNTRFGTPRSMEDIKDRFYSILYELTQLKDPNSQPIAYDAEHERRRKEQLSKQWNRTKEELEEEEQLIVELRKIEMRKKERERKAHDLQKLINMADAPASPSASGSGISPALGKKKSTFRVKTGSMSTNAPTAIFNPVDISVSALRFPEFKSAGAHLRSQEMKLPTNIGQKKLKNIEVILEKSKMEMNPMGSEAIVNIYNEFRSQIMLLQELKATLQTAEFELESMRGRFQEHGKKFDIEPRMRISSLSEGGLDESMVNGEPGNPTTTRRLASYIDVSTLNSVSSLTSRKRKTVVAPSPMELKRSRKL
ncbi:unnamed protein product [Caenorhabditis auriculariae]|uniref:DNA methyltransferase 1-associated protein 1 n=1 Tax=Caenorhabditis auriculariae TaxID=2777116 RepID=A0A8S1GMN1_9PELO|nr:unnamed protein product [Caenorhabditis auriculariae]